MKSSLSMIDEGGGLTCRAPGLSIKVPNPNLAINPGTNHSPQSNLPSTRSFCPVI